MSRLPFVRRYLWCLCLLLSMPVLAWADPVSDYNVAVEFYKQQRWDLAAQSCESFLEKYPNHERAPAARLYLGQSLLHLQKFEQARSEFQEFLKQTPQHPDRPLAAYRIGECSYFLGQYGLASEQLKKFVGEFPKHSLVNWALVYLGESYYRLKKFAAAVDTFQTALQRELPGRLKDDAAFGLATSLEGLGRTQEAVEAYRKLADQPDSPRAADAQFNLGARYFEEEQYEQASQFFAKLIEQHPDSRLAPLAELNAGYALYHLEKYQPAIERFQAAAQAPAQAAVATYWIGLSQKSLGNYEAAAETLQKALKANPPRELSEKLTFQLGDTEFRLKHFDQAIALLTRVTDQWPQAELADDALQSAGEAALQAGQLNQAEALHKRFMKEYPDSGLLLVQRLLGARILIAQGDQLDVPQEQRARFTQAVEILNDVVSQSNLDQTQALARFELARAYERLKQDENVVRVLKPILTPENDAAKEFVEGWLLRGNAHLRQDENSQALSDYEHYLTLVDEPARQIPALTGISSALIGMQDWKQLPSVLSRLHQADTHDTQFSSSTMAAGDAAFEAKNWDAAATFFQLVLDQAPQGEYALPARSGLAHTRYEQQEFAAAAELFQNVAEDARNDPLLQTHSAYMQALSLQQAGEEQQAVDVVQTALKAFSSSKEGLAGPDESPEVRKNLYQLAKAGARAARNVEQIAVADTLYEQAYRQLKTLPEEEQAELDLLINEWADLSYNAENYKRSDELYRLLVKERPKSPLADDARLILAESLRFGDHPEEARQAFQELADSSQSDEFVKQRALVHLLDLAAESKDWASVVTISRRFLKEFPDNEHRNYTRHRRGEALLQQGDLAQAAEVLQSLKDDFARDLGAAPDWWPETWLLLAETRLAQKEYDKLDELLSEFKTQAKGSPLLYRADALLGRSLENRARFVAARAAYQRVIDSESGRGTETAAESQFRIAESYLKENNLQAALREYYKVYAGYDAPRYEAAALFQAATCDVSLKNPAEAAQTFRKLLKEFPESEFADRAAARLKELDAANPTSEQNAPAQAAPGEPTL